MENTIRIKNMETEEIREYTAEDFFNDFILEEKVGKCLETDFDKVENFFAKELREVLLGEDNEIFYSIVNPVEETYRIIKGEIFLYEEGTFCFAEPYIDYYERQIRVLKRILKRE